MGRWRRRVHAARRFSFAVLLGGRRQFLHFDMFGRDMMGRGWVCSVFVGFLSCVSSRVHCMIGSGLKRNGSKAVVGRGMKKRLDTTRRHHLHTCLARAIEAHVRFRKVWFLFLVFCCGDVACSVFMPFSRWFESATYYLTSGVRQLRLPTSTQSANEADSKVLHTMSRVGVCVKCL